MIKLPYELEKMAKKLAASARKKAKKQRRNRFYRSPNGLL